MSEEPPRKRLRRFQSMRDSILSTMSLHEISPPSQCGSVLVLGLGDMGQLGLGESHTERTYPTRLIDPDSKEELFPNQVVQICAGGIHTICLLVASGGDVTDQVHSWGCNDEAALGRETNGDSELEMCPHPVAALTEMGQKIIQISAGDSHSAALTESGEVFVWGTFRDSSGMFGLVEPFKKSLVPMKLPIPKKVIKIASGTDHLAALSCEGQLYTVGCAEQGQLGRIPEHNANRGGRGGVAKLLEPAVCRTGGSSVIIDVWAGSASTVVLAKMGRSATLGLFACGLNNFGQLGLPEADDGVTCSYMLQKVPLPDEVGNVKNVALGQHHTLLLNDKGMVFAIGSHEYGRLGLPKEVLPTDIPAVLKFTHVAALKDKVISAIACGSICSFAIDSEGKVWSWGIGSNKQLGCGDGDDLYEPTAMGGKNLADKVCLMVSAGGQHTVLLVKDS